MEGMEPDEGADPADSAALVALLDLVCWLVSARLASCLGAAALGEGDDEHDSVPRSSLSTSMAKPSDSLLSSAETT